MRKVFLLMLLVFGFASCTPDTEVNEPTEIELTDPKKICPPGQPNC